MTRGLGVLRRGSTARRLRARRLVAGVVAIGLATVSAIALGPASPSGAFPLAGTNVRISPPPPAGVPDGDSFGPSMSHNGRFVAYLAPWTTDRTVDAVYVKDRNSPNPPQVAVAPTPLTCVNGEFTFTEKITFNNVAMSDDAKTFAIGVSRLADPGVDCGQSNEYVEYVSGGAAPVVAPFSRACAQKAGTFFYTSFADLDGMSADGKQVLIDTRPDLNNAVATCLPKLFTWTPATGASFDVINDQTTPVAQLEPLTPGAISADGAHVAFVGQIPGAGETPTLYTYDRDVDGNGVFDEPNVAANDHRIFQAIPFALNHPANSNVGLSRDGRVVAFSFRTVGADFDQLEVLDRDPATSKHKFPLEPDAQRAYTTLTNGDGSSFSPALSADGRYVAFVSEANNLLTGVTLDPNGTCNDGEPPSCRVYIADRIGIGGKPQIELASDGEVKGGTFVPPNPNGDSMQFGGVPGLSDDGRVIAYDSYADNLLPTLECDKPPCDAANPDHDADVFVHLTQPSLVGAPNPLNLGSAAFGSSTPPRVAQFTTTGFGAVRPTSIDIVGPDHDEFTVQPASTCVGMVLHAADKCFVSIVFKAIRHGSATATLEVHHNGNGGVAKVVLLGGGVNALGVFSLTPPVLDFGTQILTVQPAAQSVTARNSATTPLIFDPSTINGAASSDYHVVTDTCQTINPAHELLPGQSCTISVAFKPRSVGDRHAALIVSAHVPGQPGFVEMVDLRGTSPMPSVVLSPGVAHPRSVVQAVGENWPPGSTVTLRFSGLPGVQGRNFKVPATATVPNVQQFDPSASVLVYPRAAVGTRTLTSSAPNSAVDMSPAAPLGLAISFPVNFLVQSPSVNGELGFTVRNG